MSYDTLIDGECVDTVTISPKFRVVIPRAVRERLSLEPGQKAHAVAYDGRIELIPIRSLATMRGFLRGIDTAVSRASATGPD